MNILIVGMGEVGFHLAKVLSAGKHSVTVIDSDPIKIKRVGDALDVQSLLGDASHPLVLDAAEAPTADLVLAVSDNDQVNMLCALFAKRMGAGASIVRVRDLEPYRRYRSLLRKNILFDEMLSLEDLAAEEIAKIVRRNQAVAVENFLDGQVTLRVIPLTGESPLVGQTLREVKKPSNLLVVAVRRDEKTMIPDGDQDFCEGDEVYVLGRPSSVEEFEAWVGHRKGRTRNVIIFGSSGVAFQTARSLERHGVKLRLMSEDLGRCDRFAEELKKTTVLHVDGTDLDVFKEEQVGSADAFVGASDVDERNLLACQVARELGCKRTIALVNRPDYTDLYQIIGITRAVSPRLLCSDAIVNRVQAGSLSLLAALDEGEAKVCAGRVEARSRLVKKALKDAKFPKGCVVAAIQRTVDGSEEVLIPEGDDVLDEHDRLILFLLPAVESKVFGLLQAKGSG